jgi:DNA-binding transcriptional MerR regulator
MPSKYYSISEVSQLSGVAAHRIHYAIKQKLIKTPLSLNGRRCFSRADLDRIREHFGVRVLVPVDPEDGRFTP